MIYFLHCEATGLTKIGTARDPVDRCSDLARMNGSPVRIVALLMGDLSEEQELHRQHAPHRRHGEWFELPPEAVPPTDSAWAPLLGDPLRPDVCRCITRAPCRACQLAARYAARLFQSQGREVPWFVDAVARGKEPHGLEDREITAAIESLSVSPPPRPPSVAT